MVAAVTVPDVVAMTQARVDEGVIIDRIHTHGIAAPLQTNDVIYLHQQGVSGNVIAAMQSQPVAGADGAAGAILLPAAGCGVCRWRSITTSVRVTIIRRRRWASALDSGVENLLVMAQKARGRAIGREVCFDALSSICALVAAAGQDRAANRGCASHCRRIVGRNKHRRIAFRRKDFRRAADIGGHDRPAGRGGLQENTAQRLLPRGMNQQCQFGK